MMSDDHTYHEEDSNAMLDLRKAAALDEKLVKMLKGTA